MATPKDSWGADEFEHVVREEAEELEQAVEIARLRTRTLSEAAADLASRGDRVTATCGSTVLPGYLAGVSGDLALLTAGETEASINLAGPVTISRIAQSSSGGTTIRGGARSFRARLLEFEMSGEPVTLVGEHLTEDGVIGSVGADHVVFDRGIGEMYVPTSLIGMVLRPTPRVRS